MLLHPVRFYYTKQLQNKIDNNNLTVDEAKVLIEKGASINMRDPESLGDTALHLVLRKKRLDLLQLFIAKGGDIHKKSDAQCSPLMTACAHGFFEGAKLLLEKGAKPTDKNDYGLRAIDYLPAQYERGTKLMSLLLKHGADPFLKNRNGLTLEEKLMHNPSIYSEVISLINLPKKKQVYMGLCFGEGHFTIFAPKKNEKGEEEHLLADDNVIHMALNFL